MADAATYPVLRAMHDRAAAAGVFAGADRLLEDRAGVRLTAKRVERAAERRGSAKAAADRSRAALATSGKLACWDCPGLRRGLFTGTCGTAWVVCSM